jgi:hypothetical protein
MLIAAESVRGPQTISTTASSETTETNSGNEQSVTIVKIVKPLNLIFSDGFEFGDTSAWSTTRANIILPTQELSQGFRLHLSKEGFEHLFLTEGRPWTVVSFHGVDEAPTLLLYIEAGPQGLVITAEGSSILGVQARDSASLAIGTSSLDLRIEMASASAAARQLIIATEEMELLRIQLPAASLHQLRSYGATLSYLSVIAAEPNDPSEP